MAIIYWVLPKSQALCCKHLYSVLHFTFTRVRSGSHYLSPPPLNRREFPKGKLCPWRVEWLAWGQSSSMRTRGIRAECLYLWSLHSHASGASLRISTTIYWTPTSFIKVVTITLIMQLVAKKPKCSTKGAELGKNYLTLLHWNRMLTLKILL